MSTRLDPGARLGGSSAPRAPVASPPPERDPGQPARLPSRLDGRRAPTPRSVLAIASIGVFVAFVDSTVVNIAFPSLERSFPSAGASGVSWVLSAYNVTFAAFLVAGGRIADVFGRKRLFSLSLVLFTVGSELCAVAPTLPLLVAARVIQAIGAALMIPSSLGLILAAFPIEARSHAVALLTAVGAAAAGVGPSLGGLLISAGSWRLVFLVNAPIGLVGWLLAGRKLVESRAPGRRRVPDLTGAMLFAAGAALVLLGIVQGHAWGWSGGRVLASFAFGLALLCAFAWRCAHHRDPLLDPELLRVRSFRIANAMTIVASSGYYGYTLCNVLFLTSIWHYSILDTGLALTPGPLVAVLVAASSSRVAEKLGPRAVVVPGALVWGGAVLWMVYRVGPRPDFVGQWLPGMALLGVGAGLVFSNLGSAAVATAARRSFATASALNSVARQLGAALGVAITVTIISTPSPLGAFSALHHAWIVAAGCLAGAGLGFAFLGRLPAGTDDEGGTLPSLTASTKAVLSARVLSSPSAPAPGPALAPALIDAPAHAVTAETISDFLARVPIFAGLSAELLDMVAARSRSLDLAAGEWLLRAGEEGDAMYIVRAGRLQVVVETTPQVLREVGRGDAVGELALITGEPRAASVRAARPTAIIAVDRAAFEDLLGRSAELAGSVSRVLARQLRESQPVSSARPLPGTIAIVTLGAPAPTPATATAFAHALGAALERDASVSLLDGTLAPHPGAQADLAFFGPLLDRCEREDNRVLLLAGDALSHDRWTRFCLQHADRILVLTAGGPIPAGLDQRPELRGCDLVAWSVQPGSGALAGWADALVPIETHAFPKALDSRGQFERMARRLNGRAVGLVLSGGGARALAHIGAIEELLAAGVTIDRVAGVSMGAYIGALLAHGLRADEIDARCYEEFARRRPFGDFTLPRASLIRGDRFVSTLERSFGELAVEELERSFFCTATDLRSSESIVLRRGPLVDVVGASMCLPVLAAPLVSGRRLLVDGSLTDNLPIAPMSELGEGPIIAVDVKASFKQPTGAAGAKPSDEPRRKPRSRPALTPSQRLRERWAGGERSTPPHLGETLTRLFLLASSRTSEAAARHADLVIAPRNPGLGLLEFHQIDAAREAGRRAAREALEHAPGSLFP